MKLLDRAKRAAIAALESIEKDTEAVPRRASELSASLSRELDLTTELTRLKRRSRRDGSTFDQNLAGICGVNAS